MSDRGSNFYSPERTSNGAAPLISLIPVLAGSAVYFAFAERLDLPEAHAPWWGELLEVTPALLVGMLFQVFVLVPLSHVFARARLNSPLLFLAFSMIIWTGVAATILFRTKALLQGDPWVDASILGDFHVTHVRHRLLGMNAQALSGRHESALGTLNTASLQMPASVLLRYSSTDSLVGARDNQHDDKAEFRIDPAKAWSRLDHRCCGRRS